MDMAAVDGPVLSSFASVDFSYSRDPELIQLARLVRNDLDDVDNWGKLIEAAQAQEGGLNRNSNPQAIAATRETFDSLLARFPLFFGFWKKYADLEFTIGGPEAAEMIYERGIASIATSVDLWTNYCAFKVETSHDPDVIRVLFERAVESAGLDFLAHPLWDKYIEYEERIEASDRVFTLLERIIRIPLHQYARYFEKFIALAQQRPIEELGPANVVEDIKAAVTRELSQRPVKPADIEREIRLRCNELHREIFTQTQDETTKRWVFEQEIRRPYFHVSELDEPQLLNWHKYLDFEEAEGNHARVKFLYERCLVTTALYDEFWLRYVRWLLGQSQMEKYIRIEEVRYVFRRACCIFVPISQPAIRLNYARYEESLGHSQSAVEILEDVLRTMPGHVDTIKAIANVYRRSSGVDAAIEFLQQQITAISDAEVRSALVVDQARLVWRVKGDADAARTIFENHHPSARSSRSFWTGWFEFESAQPTSAQLEPANAARIKHVYSLVRQHPEIPHEITSELTALYFSYLEDRGGPDAMQEYIDLDKAIHGPPSVAAAAVADTKAADGIAKIPTGPAAAARPSSNGTSASPYPQPQHGGGY